MESYLAYGDRLLSTASEDESRLSSFTPSWDRSPLEQGLEDAEKFLHNTRALECNAIQVRVKGWKVVDDDARRAFTMFEIEVSTGHSKWVVERRYRDFYYLHKQLRKYFPNVALPNLPGKRYLGSSTDLAFIEERAKHLNAYITMLAANKEVWTRSDIVKFLDSEQHTLMFVWNFQRMRKMQHMLGSMHDANRAAELEDELRDAQAQVRELQERIAQMEMLFLQNAAGVAVNDIPASTISRLVGRTTGEENSTASDGEEDHEGGDSGHSPKLLLSSGSRGNSFSSGDLFAPLDDMLLTGANPANVARAISYATGRTSSLTATSRSEEVSAVRLSLQIREAMTLSNEMLSDPYLTDKLRKEADAYDEKAELEWSSRLTLTLRPSEQQEQMVSALLDLRANSTIPIWVQRAIAHTDSITTWISPSYKAMEERMRVLEYVRGIVSRALGARLFAVGSFGLRTFLPDGDIDASAFLCLGQEENWFIKVNEALCLCAMNTRTATGPDRCVVKNVSFINAEVKIVKTVINNVSIDISANQLPAIYTAALFDELDRFVGKHYLFKRSVLLIKAWCKYESERFSGGKGSCFGSQEGRLSTSSLNIMITALFNKKLPKIDSPLQVLLYFLEAYSAFDWHKYAITVRGPVSAIDLSPVDLEADDLEFWRGPNCIPDAIFEKYQQRFAEACSASMREREGLEVASNEVAWAHGQDHFYRRGLMNVVDPVWPSQTVNRNVTLAGASAVCAALSEGYNTVLAYVLQASRQEEALAKAVQKYKQAGGIAAGDAAAAAAAASPAEAEAETEAKAEVEKTSTESGEAGAAATTAQVATEPEAPDVDVHCCPMVSHLFVNTIEQYARGDGWRPDLGWHTVGNVSEPRNLFDTRQQDFETSMSHAELVLANQITPEALISMVVHVLEMKGPLPVGEIGKQLQEATGNPQLSQVLKERYGGLKKFIEGISSIVHVGEDHPFNPHVYLPSQAPPPRHDHREGGTGHGHQSKPAGTRRTPPASPQLASQPGQHPSGAAAMGQKGPKKQTRNKPRSSSFGTTAPTAPNRQRQRHSAGRTQMNGMYMAEQDPNAAAAMAMSVPEYADPSTHLMLPPGVMFAPVMGYAAPPPMQSPGQPVYYQYSGAPTSSPGQHGHAHPPTHPQAHNP